MASAANLHLCSRNTSGGRSSDIALPAKLISGVAILLEARDYAEQTGGSRWEFAVEIQQLRSLDLSRNDLRWLVRRRWVEHACEVTIPGDDGRQFRPTGDLTFTRRSCFVLTTDGVVAARDIRNSRAEREMPVETNVKPKADAATLATPLAPTWDRHRRELCIDGQIVKRFKWHAANQETVLAAFEEEGWPPRIDDPLPPQPEQDTKRRLSDTIKCLNRKQQHRLICFRGDGTGEGVVWQFVDPDGCDTNGR